jgi:hypothetical protein
MAHNKRGLNGFDIGREPGGPFCCWLLNDAAELSGMYLHRMLAYLHTVPGDTITVQSSHFLLSRPNMPFFVERCLSSPSFELIARRGCK